MIIYFVQNNVYKYMIKINHYNELSVYSDNIE